MKKEEWWSCEELSKQRPYEGGGSSDHPIAVQILKWGGMLYGRSGGMLTAHVGQVRVGKGEVGRRRRRDTPGADLFSHSPTHTSPACCTFNERNYIKAILIYQPIYF